MVTVKIMCVSLRKLCVVFTMFTTTVTVLNGRRFKELEGVELPGSREIEYTGGHNENGIIKTDRRYIM